MFRGTSEQQNGQNGEKQHYHYLERLCEVFRGKLVYGGKSPEGSHIALNSRYKFGAASCDFSGIRILFLLFTVATT